MDNKPTITPKSKYSLVYRGTACLNCSHSLDISDRYCPNCSQINSTKKISLKHFFDEFFANLISYDSKLLKTLSALLLRPGSITKDYIAGKRVSYTNPFRFLLSLAVVYFLMLNFSGDFKKLDHSNASNPNNTNIQEIFDFENKDTNNASAPSLDNNLKNDSLYTANQNAYFGSLTKLDYTDRFTEKTKFYRHIIKKKNSYTFKQVSDSFNIKNSWENKILYNISHSVNRASNSPGSFISSLVSKLPFLIFFFLPVFTLFIWLMYIRKNYSYTDHLIFSFHNQSLLFILLGISFIIDSVFHTDTSEIFFLIFGIYLYKALRKFYQQRRFKTIVKYMFLNTIFFILATVSIILLLAGSVFTY